MGKKPTGQPFCGRLNFKSSRGIGCKKSIHNRKNQKKSKDIRASSPNTGRKPTKKAIKAHNTQAKSPLPRHKAHYRGKKPTRKAKSPLKRAKSPH